MKRSSFVNVFRAMVVCGVVLASMSASADWPQFQGPNRDGTSPETGLLRAWPEGGPKVLWSFPLGAGFAGPAVRDGEVYILDRVEERQDVLRCLDLKTGEELWNCAYDAPGTVGQDGSRTAPAIDEKYVYTVGMLGDFYCIDRTTHRPVWNKHLLDDFKSRKSSWGVAQSPSLYKDLVIVAPQAPKTCVVAFDRVSGDLVWKSEPLGRFGYSSPVVTKLAGVDQAVMIGAQTRRNAWPGYVAGFSLENGETLWAYDGWECKIPIPYAVALPDDRLFITGGYKSGSAMLQITRAGDAFTVNELFKTDVCGSQIHQPLLHEGHLYANSNSNDRSDGMVCMTLDGQLKWRTEDTPGLPNFERGNLILADNMIINLDGKTGELHLVDPSPEGYKELARAKVLDGKRMWSPMALSDGKLLLRDQEQMKCLDLRNP